MSAENGAVAVLRAAAVQQGHAVGFTLSGLAATEELATALGTCLRAGDTVLLSGALGAGKSVLARQVIRTAVGDPALEVPSPSYTLVNAYEPDAGAPLWHADLYRLGDPSELAELGLDEAFATAIVLIEWPERLATRPARRLEIDLTAAPDTAPDAHVSLDPADERREVQLRAFGDWPAFRDAP